LQLELPESHFISKKSKVSGVSVTATRDNASVGDSVVTKDPQKIKPNPERILIPTSILSKAGIYEIPQMRIR